MRKNVFLIVGGMLYTEGRPTAVSTLKKEAEAYLRSTGYVYSKVQGLWENLDTGDGNSRWARIDKVPLITF